jgi:hypothetical protein
MSKKRYTEVIRLKDMEAQGGTAYMNKPLPEKLGDAAKAYTAGLMVLEKNLSKVSKKGLKRLLISALQIPEEKMEVEFSSKIEEFCFGVVQRVLQSKFQLVYNNIVQEVKYRKSVEMDIAIKEANKNKLNNKEKKNE